MIRQKILKSFMAVVALVVITCGITSCALLGGMTKTQKESLSYKNDRPIFVGVYQGLNTDNTVAVFTGFDVLKNEYSGYFHFKAKNLATFGLTYSFCRCTIKITTEKGENGETKIVVKASEPKLQNSQTKSFENYNLDLVNIENEVSKAIASIMNEPDNEFEQKLDKTISNLDFIYSVSYGMNSIAFKKWMDDMKITERTLIFTMPLYELSESSHEGYKYQITGIFTPEEEKRNNWVTQDMLIFFRTNNDEYIKYRKGENITLKGKIESIQQNKLDKGYTINMTE